MLPSDEGQRRKPWGQQARSTDGQGVLVARQSLNLRGLSGTQPFHEEDCADQIRVCQPSAPSSPYFPPALLAAHMGPIDPIQQLLYTFSHSLGKRGRCSLQVARWDLSTSRRAQRSPG